MRSESGRRQSTSPSRNSAQNDEPDPGAVDLRRRRTRPGSRAPSSRRPAGPVQASVTDAGRVVDLAGRDLARLARPDVHRPGALRVGRVGDRVRRVARQPVGDLRRRRGRSGSPAPSVERGAGCGRQGSRGVGIVAVVVVVPRAPPGRARARARGRRRVSLAERPELVAEEVERRDEDDRDRLREDFRQSSTSMKRTSQSWFTPKASTETTKKRAPWAPKLPLLVRERPVAVPPVVARRRDDERDRRRDVRAPAEQRGVDDEVDDVAAGADGAELRELDPVCRPPERGTRARGDGHCREASGRRCAQRLAARATVIGASR